MAATMRLPVSSAKTLLSPPRTMRAGQVILETHSQRYSVGGRSRVRLGSRRALSVFHVHLPLGSCFMLCFRLARICSTGRR